MKKPKRLTALIITAILMLTVAVVAVAADEETSLSDIKSIVTVTKDKE